MKATPNRATCQGCGAPLARPVVRDEKGRLRLVKGFRASSYTRMKPDRPAATITTASGHVGCDRTLHPSENRVLSPLECAYLQTFPGDFEWGDSLEQWGSTKVRAMIGEAVPPGFTTLHGSFLAGLLTGAHHRPAISSSDPRVARAVRRLRAAEADARRASRRR